MFVFQALDLASTLALDLDDLLFLYSEQDDRINLYEAYKIPNTVKDVGETIVLDYGHFNKTSSSLVLASEDIWHRRANLKVL
jgi:hypothetical protein